MTRVKKAHIKPRVINKIIVLRSEEDAWKLLEDLQNDTEIKPSNLKLGKWTKLHIHLQGKKWNNNISPSVFPVFENLQKLVYNLYAETKSDGGKIGKLTNEEMDDLEIFISIGKGSSILENVNWEDVFKELIPKLLDKMTPTQVCIVLLAVVLSIGGNYAWRAFLNHRREIRLAETNNNDKKNMLDSIIGLSELETKRMQMLANTVESNPVLRHIAPDIEKLQESKLRAATKATQSEIAGVQLTCKIAKELLKETQGPQSDIRIDGKFTIKAFNLYHLEDGQVKVTLAHVDNESETITPTFDKSVFPFEMQKVLQENAFSGVPINAEINARKYGDKLKEIRLVTVKKLTE